ncbi:signal peptidase I [Clostridium sp.]|jgi:signal peptidase I|uniref:signal peptidase I n=1 Tax=Clostridium sp. TaxID=1506 RepID=UPI0037C06EF7
MKEIDGRTRNGLIPMLIGKGSFFREWIIPIVAAIGIAFLINKFLVYNVYIPSESMVPTLNVGDKLMVTRVYDTSKIKRGDIIVFYSDELNEVLIKRAIGLPGDHIEIHNGIVNINGTDIKEDYVKNNEVYNGTFDVPQNKFFFLGDNRNRSNDARRWINPYIDASKIQGKAQIKFYPFKDFGSLK